MEHQQRRKNPKLMSLLIKICCLFVLLTNFYSAEAQIYSYSNCFSIDYEGKIAVGQKVSFNDVVNFVAGIGRVYTPFVSASVLVGVLQFPVRLGLQPR